MWEDKIDRLDASGNLPQLDKYPIAVDQFSGDAVDFDDLGFERCDQRVFHFHRFDNQQLLLGFDRLTRLDKHFDHLARHGGDDLGFVAVFPLVGAKMVTIFR